MPSGSWRLDISPPLSFLSRVTSPFAAIKAEVIWLSLVSKVQPHAIMALAWLSKLARSPRGLQSHGADRGYVKPWAQKGGPWAEATWSLYPLWTES
jgi:hypothetical protein